MKENIDYLLDKYFEGLTSLKEEETLREYFNSEAVHETHLRFRALFGYFTQQRHLPDTGMTSEAPSFPGRNPAITRYRKIRPILIAITATAACLALTATFFRWSSNRDLCPGTGSYAMIDGKCYTDKVLIEHFMNQSRRAVSEELHADPVSDQLQQLNFFSDATPESSHN